MTVDDDAFGMGKNKGRVSGYPSATETRRQLLYVKMRMAEARAAWEAAAIELDELEGNNAWKAETASPDYDVRLVDARCQQLDEARLSGDASRMLFLVRTALTRNLGDMGNLRMYKHSHVGTKLSIDRYINSALATIESLVNLSIISRDGCLNPRHALEQMLSTRQAFGRSALLLSGGANFGMSHTGVLKALWEAKLLPRIVSGASAGSIICSVLCTTNDEDIPNLLSTFCDGDFTVFGQTGSEDGLLRKTARFLKHGALFDIGHLTRVMRGMLGDITFQEAYNRTRKILNICVSSASLYELPRLLNYVTAPNVLIWSAVAASCSVPLLYNAASILAKDPKTGQAVPWNPLPQRWIDGSVDNDIPMTRLAELFNVNHFIVSQVNPHVVPFIVKDQELVGHTDKPNLSSWLHSAAHLARGEALHQMHTLSELGIFPNLLSKAVSVLSQKYSGDITILPQISYADFPNMLSNPTRQFVSSSMLAGERATWPKMSIIRNHCAIELALDDAVQRLRARVVFSPSKHKPITRDASQRRSSSPISARGSRPPSRLSPSKTRPPALVKQHSMILDSQYQHRRSLSSLPSAGDTPSRRPEQSDSPNLSPTSPPFNFDTAVSNHKPRTPSLCSFPLGREDSAAEPTFLRKQPSMQLTAEDTTPLNLSPVTSEDEREFQGLLATATQSSTKNAGLSLTIPR